MEKYANVTRKHPSNKPRAKFVGSIRRKFLRRTSSGALVLVFTVDSISLSLSLSLSLSISPILWGWGRERERRQWWRCRGERYRDRLYYCYWTGTGTGTGTGLGLRPPVVLFFAILIIKQNDAIQHVTLHNTKFQGGEEEAFSQKNQKKKGRRLNFFFCLTLKKIKMGFI
jgi:hypothetical protein